MAHVATAPPCYALGLVDLAAYCLPSLFARQLCLPALVVQAFADRSTAQSASECRKGDLMKILLAVDHSAYSAAAVETVATRPWPPGTVVRVLSTVEQIPIPAAELWYDARGSLDLARQEITKQHEELAKSAAESLRNHGLVVEPVVRDGDPRMVIVEEAKEWSADLIVVGSHGRTGIKRWLMGSVAHSVVSHAPCSVEVVRQKVTEEA